VAFLATPLIAPVAPSPEARPFELARVAVRLLAPFDCALLLRVVRFVALAFAVLRVCDGRFLAALPPDFALAFARLPERFEVLVFGWGWAIPRSSWFTRPDA
jgi:hypothetical protein